MSRLNDLERQLPAGATGPIVPANLQPIPANRPTRQQLRRRANAMIVDMLDKNIPRAQRRAEARDAMKRLWKKSRTR